MDRFQNPEATATQILSGRGADQDLVFDDEDRRGRRCPVDAGRAFCFWSMLSPAVLTVGRPAVRRVIRATRGDRVRLRPSYNWYLVRRLVWRVRTLRRNGLRRSVDGAQLGQWKSRGGRTTKLY